MRKKNQKHLPLLAVNIDHPPEAELKGINKILDENHIINEMVFQDFNRGVKNRRSTGAEGMSSEQVVRAAIIKQWEGFSYEDLSFHIVDSRSYWNFCGIGIAHNVFVL